MDKIVQIDGVGNVSFPDSMSDDQISAVIKQQHPDLTKAKPLSLYEQARASFIAKKGNVGMPGSFEGHPENVGEYVPATAGRAIEGAVDMSRGNVAMGAHKIVQAGSNALAPMAPYAIAGAPVMAARGIIGGMAGGKVAETGAKLTGATDDQANLASDAGNILAGFSAASGLPRALLQTPMKELILKNPDLIHTILEPRKAAIKWLGSQIEDRLGVMGGAPAAAEAPAFNQSAGGSPMFNNQPQINVRPDPNARPSFVTRPASPSTVVPTPRNIPIVAPPKSTAVPLLDPNRAPLDRQLPAASQPPIPDYFTQMKMGAGPRGTKLEMPVISPNAEPPMLKPSAAATPKTKAAQMMDDLRQWDMIRKLHDEMDNQIGMGQDEAQAWMEAHNQKAAGAKVSADAAKAQAPIPQESQPEVPTKPGDIERLLLKTLSDLKAKGQAN